MKNFKLEANFKQQADGNYKVEGVAYPLDPIDPAPEDPKKPTPIPVPQLQATGQSWDSRNEVKGYEYCNVLYARDRWGVITSVKKSIGERKVQLHSPLGDMSWGPDSGSVFVAYDYSRDELWRISLDERKFKTSVAGFSNPYRYLPIGDNWVDFVYKSTSLGKPGDTMSVYDGEQWKKFDSGIEGTYLRNWGRVGINGEIIPCSFTLGILEDPLEAQVYTMSVTKLDDKYIALVGIFYINEITGFSQRGTISPVWATSENGIDWVFPFGITAAIPVEPGSMYTPGPSWLHWGKDLRICVSHSPFEHNEFNGEIITSELYRISKETLKKALQI